MKLKEQQFIDNVLDHGMDPYTANEAGLTALNLAIINDQPYYVKLLIDMHPETVHQRDASGRTPLGYACRPNTVAIAKFLISRGADPYSDSQFDLIQNFIESNYSAEVLKASQLAWELYPECNIESHQIYDCFDGLKIARDHALPYLAGIFVNAIHNDYKKSNDADREWINCNLAELGYPTACYHYSGPEFDTSHATLRTPDFGGLLHYACEDSFDSTHDDNAFMQERRIYGLKELEELMASSKKKEPEKSSEPKESLDDEAIPDVLDTVDIKLPNDNVLRLNYLSFKAKESSSSSNQKEESSSDLDTDFPELPGSSASSRTFSKRGMS